MAKRGLVLGKFMPPHVGHTALARFAEGFCDELTIAVDSPSGEPWPAKQRASWMEKGFPLARVFCLPNGSPQDPSENPDFWRWWRDALTVGAGGAPDVLVCSMPYGKRLSEELVCEWVPFDMERAGVGVCATQIRADIVGNWRFVAPYARHGLVKRVVVTGPESSGKSTLAAALGRAFDTVAVPEYARDEIFANGWGGGDSWFERIAKGQVESERALAEFSGPVLFSDTDAATTVRWQTELEGAACAGVLAVAAEERLPDLAIIVSPEGVGFDTAPHRTSDGQEESRRFRMFEGAVSWARGNGIPFVVAKGGEDERLSLCVSAVETRLGVPISGVSR